MHLAGLWRLPIVFVTGYSDVSDDDLKQRVPPISRLHFYRKPLSFTALARASSPSPRIRPISVASCKRASQAARRCAYCSGHDGAVKQRRDEAPQPAQVLAVVVAAHDDDDGPALDPGPQLRDALAVQEQVLLAPEELAFLAFLYSHDPVDLL